MRNIDSDGRAAGAFSAFAAAQPDAGFSDWLTARTEPDWEAAVGHRFTVELGEDRIDDAVYRRYLIQDYAFIETLVGVVGFAVGRAPGMDRKMVFAGFLAALTGDENDYFQRSFDALDVPAAEREFPPMGPVTADLRALLADAVKVGYAEILSVFLPAEWIYLTWAQAQAGNHLNRFYLKEWIGLHVVPEFETFVDWMRGEVDALGPTLAADRQ
jgi:thiaminase/transcriptional activator TenA